MDRNWLLSCWSTFWVHISPCFERRVFSLDQISVEGSQSLLGRVDGQECCFPRPALPLSFPRDRVPAQPLHPLCPLPFRVRERGASLWVCSIICKGSFGLDGFEGFFSTLKVYDSMNLQTLNWGEPTNASVWLLHYKWYDCFPSL